MKIPLVDIIPRCRQLVDRPEHITVVLVISTLLGIIEGLALTSLLPLITSLGTGQPAWGLDTGGWLIVLVVFGALGVVGVFTQTSRGYDVALDMLKTLHRRVGNQIAVQPLGWFAKPIAGKVSRMVASELMRTGEIIAHMLAPLATRLASIVTILIVTWFWDARLGFVLTVALPVLILIMLAAAALNRTARNWVEPRDVALAERIVEFTRCQPALRSTGHSQNYRPLRQDMHNEYRAKGKALVLETCSILLSGAFTQVVAVALIMVAAQLAVDGALDTLPALAFIGIALRFSTSLSAIVETAIAIETRRQMLDTVDDILNAEPLPTPTTPADLPRPGEISMDHVGFTYPGASQTTLNDVSFTVAPRTMTAVVGPSGSGKTTIARLISRFYDTNAGTVSVGGVDVRQQTTEQLMAQLSMVFQDVYLFDDTLAANIAVGRAGATRDEVLAAADLAGVTPIAQRLPGGWDAAVGEGGTRLSGGERQRVAIARALLKNSPIVLLDEATSALDVENEEHIAGAFNELSQRATVLVIAHKLGTIKQADQIVLLTDTGAVEAVGTHAELMSEDSTYAHYWRLLEQAKGWQLN